MKNTFLITLCFFYFMSTTFAQSSNQLYISSNNQNQIGVLNIDDQSITSFTSEAMDADGIHYDAVTDVLYQLNRTTSVVNAYSTASTNPTLSATSSSDFTNGREIAVNGNRLIVAEDVDGANRLYVYNISPNVISLINTYDVAINLWGLHLDGETLYAIADNTNELAIYEDIFSNADGAVAATSTVVVEGIVRTHGITLLPNRDMMVLTDVGSGAVDNDGAYAYIKGYRDAIEDGMISLSEQTRVEGAATLLGNPVDVALDVRNKMIFIAERANGGGRILGFPMNASGDVAPTYSQDYAGASAVYLGVDKAVQIYASSNTSGFIGVMASYRDGSVSNTNFASSAVDADGIYYDAANDVLYQLNRTDNVVSAYGNYMATLRAGNLPVISTASMTGDFTNGREITLSGNRLVVAEDIDGGTNRLYVYTASAAAITLINTYDVSFNLWGIQANGEDLIAIMDNTDQVAVFNNFFSNVDGAITASSMFTVENMIRTHGLDYDANRDIMLLTDVGSGAVDDDGAFTVIRNFTAASADGNISAAEQARVEGSNTFLGNPVDIALGQSGLGVYIAERANGGGRILKFRIPTNNGNIKPIANILFAGASAVNSPSNFNCMLVDGGSVAFEGGSTDNQTIIVDNQDDFISFESTANPVTSGVPFTYIVTDADDNILGIPPGNMVEFNGAGVGNCKVYGLSYTGNITASVGDNVLSATLASGCSDLSDNTITVVRLPQGELITQAFVSSNTIGMIGVYNVLTNGIQNMQSFPSANVDADGIYYAAGTDKLYQVNRTDNIISSFTNVNQNLMNGTDPLAGPSSTSDFMNGREMAISGNRLVVAEDDDAGNKLHVYTISENAIDFDKTIDVSINLWGLHADQETLYAIVDNSNQLAVFNDFFAQPSGTLEPSATVDIEGIIRTHGITYDANRDMMLLTDVGSGAVDNDGAFTVIRNFTAASADGTVSLAEQARVEGAVTNLGNPVDIALGASGFGVYIAERANGGGRLLVFNLPAASGAFKPVRDVLFAGASAVYMAPGGTSCDVVDGGMVSLAQGGTETTIVAGDGMADVIEFSSTIDATTTGNSFTYIVTDANDMILGIPPSNMNDFEGAGVGKCRVYGVSYTGNLKATTGDNINEVDISNACFGISDNYLIVDRRAPGTLASRVFASSNNSGMAGVYNIFSNGIIGNSTFNVAAMDADGIFYDEAADVLYQLNRTDNVVNAYGTLSTSLDGGTDPMVTATSTSDFTNGREIAVSNNRVVVAEDVDNANRLLYYDASATSVSLNKSYDVDINLWGIHAAGETLYAIVDNSNQLAVFDDFFNQPAGTLTPTSIIDIEGIVRTHGITYNGTTDMMVLTDVGSGAVDNDGAFTVIKDFSVAAADGMVTLEEQIVIAGSNTFLGNPVDVAVGKSGLAIYIAERANGGGRILGFRIPSASGNAAPIYNNLFAGASAVNVVGADTSAPPSITSEEDGFLARAINTIQDVQTNRQKVSEIYPIPTSSELNVAIESDMDKVSIIQVFDMRGSLMYEQNTVLVKGLNTFTINVSSYTDGMYFIRINGSNTITKFVKNSN